MKYYIFDKNSLTYKLVRHPVYTPNFLLTSGLVMLLIGIIMLALGTYLEQQRQQQPSEKELKVLIDRVDVFTEAKFMDYLKELNVKFPKIVYAQAVLETGNFQSEVFRNNMNLFGMREAISRVSTNHGTNLNHAVYHHWRESVLDYALYQSAYLSDLKTPEQYYNYLFQHYAEDKTYVSKVKEIAETIEP